MNTSIIASLCVLGLALLAVGCDRDGTRDPGSENRAWSQVEAPEARRGAPRVEEDEVPAHSPGGAHLVDYVGKGRGAAVYEDGAVYDGKGWQE